MSIRGSKVTRVRIYAEGMSNRPRDDLGALLAREIRIQPASRIGTRHAIITPNLPEGARKEIKSAAREVRNHQAKKYPKIGFGWEKSVYRIGKLAVGIYTYENVPEMLKRHVEETSMASEVVAPARLEWKRPVADRIKHVVKTLMGRIQIDRARMELSEEHKASEAGIPVVPTYYAERRVGTMTPFVEHQTAYDLVRTHPHLTEQVERQLAEIQMKLVNIGVLEEVHHRNVFMEHNDTTGATKVVGLIDLLGIGETRRR